MKLIKQSIWLFIFFFVSEGIIAQHALSGKIFDQESNEPLPGAAVYIPELSKGTVSDSEGNYILDELPKGSFSIQFSYLGYQTRLKIIVFDQQTIHLDVGLTPTIIESQEVVVTSSSYTSQHENAVKIESINAIKLTQTGAINLMQALSKVSGVDVISKGNGIAKPVIRGLSNSNVVV